MYVCYNCFSDKELQAFIKASKNNGNCSVCDSTAIQILNIEELLDFFQELLANYELSHSGISIKNKIQGDWSFFSSHDIGSQILNHVLPRIKGNINSALDEVEYSEEIIQNYEYWDTLKTEIKEENRFLTNIQFLEEIGWDGFFNTQFQLKSNTTLYRARVHHESGMNAYELNRMGCPPSKKAGGGRANPIGIPFLYLSDNDKTVLYEVRASYLDELSIGEFTLKDGIDEIKIVDFTEDTFLFKPSHVNETIKSRLLRDRISKDLSKPMRRYDTELEYIPTQFICEYIKVITGAEGIRFTSSLHPEGKNIVIFNQELMECKKVTLMKITSLKLESDLM